MASGWCGEEAGFYSASSFVHRNKGKWKDRNKSVCRHAEGIPYSKKNVASMLSLGCFQLLVSKIKSLSTEVTWETLEQSYYGENEESNQLEYEKFKSQFLELTDADDLLRNDEIKKIFYCKMNLKDRLRT